MLKLSFSTSSLLVPGLTLAKEKRRDFGQNGIDKIFTNYPHLADIPAGLPLFITNREHTVEEVAWRTVIEAGVKKTKYPQADTWEFLCSNKATDVFVDTHQYKYFKWIYKDSPFNVHEVDLDKYNKFFTKTLKGKFDQYNKHLYVVCNLKNKRNNVIFELNNHIGYALSNPNDFYVGII